MYKKWFIYTPERSLLLRAILAMPSFPLWARRTSWFCSGRLPSFQKVFTSCNHVMKTSCSSHYLFRFISRKRYPSLSPSLNISFTPPYPALACALSCFRFLEQANKLLGLLGGPSRLCREASIAQLVFRGLGLGPSQAIGWIERDIGSVFSLGWDLPKVVSIDATLTAWMNNTYSLSLQQILPAFKKSHIFLFYNEPHPSYTQFYDPDGHYLEWFIVLTPLP